MTLYEPWDAARGAEIIAGHEHSVVTTCAYCGVGCSFKAEMRGEEVVRMLALALAAGSHPA
jgi:predicted molibdopterin-dependent oxidoreductase YjgC